MKTKKILKFKILNKKWAKQTTYIWKYQKTLISSLSLRLPGSRTNA